MQIRNLRDRPVTIAPADGTKPVVVDGGDSVEVADHIGESLLEQPDRWASVDAPAKKKQRPAPAGAESKSEEG